MNLKEVLKILLLRFKDKGIDLVLSGGLALSTMGIFRFTKDIDFLVYEESKDQILNLSRNISDYLTRRIC